MTIEEVSTGDAFSLLLWARWFCSTRRNECQTLSSVVTVVRLLTTVTSSAVGVGYESRITDVISKLEYKGGGMVRNGSEWPAISHSESGVNTNHVTRGADRAPTLFRG